MFKHARLAICCSLVLLSSHAYGTEPIKIPMTAEHWRPLGPDSMGPKADLEFIKKEGFPQGLLMAKAGTSELTGLTFRTGTIEYDFKPLSADMPGIQFRSSGPDGKQDGEEVYLRLFGDCRASNDCVQYAPMIHGFMLWNVYPQYQSQAFVLDGWNHVRLVISAHRLNVYVNYQSMPSLAIGHLESGSGAGSIKLRGPAVFANLVITPDKVDGLPVESLPDPAANDNGILRHWQVAALAPLPNPRRVEAEAEWADAAVTIPGMYHWTSGQAPVDKSWNPLDPSRGLNRPSPVGLPNFVDAEDAAAAIAEFERFGFHGPLNYYRAIQPYFDEAGAFVGATIRQPSFFAFGAEDGMVKMREISEISVREIATDLRGFLRLNGVGHWPQLEATSRINQALLGFLREVA